MLCKKEKLAIEKATDKYVELCTVDMNKAADMLKEKSEIERIQMNVILQENVEKENGRIKIYSFLTFSITILSLVMTILTFINNISLEKNKKTFPVWNIIKKIKMVYNCRNGDEKQHSLIQIDNEKKLY